MRNKYLFSLALMGALMAAPLVHADEASLGGEGGNLYVEANEFVQMQSEVIDIQIYPSRPDLLPDYWGEDDYKHRRGYAEFEIEYTFLNHSDEAVEVLMGFPEMNKGFSGEKDLNDFEALYWDGNAYKAMGVDYVASEDYRDPNWFTSTFVFEPGETRILNRYWVVPGMYKGPERSYDYVLETGASWRGVIESAEVNVHMNDDFELHDILNVNPVSDFEYFPEEKRFSWLFEDFEPTSEDNLVLSLRDPHDPGFICGSFPEESIGYASSTFPEYSEEIHYYPCAIKDNDVHTAWVEDDIDGGIGEWVEFYHSGSAQVYEAVDVFTGYGWNEESWNENARPSVLRFDFFEYHSEDLAPSLSFDLELDDVYGVQRVQLPESFESDDFGYVRIEILDYVEGDVYPHDVALSEIEFIGYIPEGVGTNWYYSDSKVEFSLAPEVKSTAMDPPPVHPIIEKYGQKEAEEQLSGLMDNVFLALKILFFVGFTSIVLLIVWLLKRQKNKAL